MIKPKDIGLLITLVITVNSCSKVNNKNMEMELSKSSLEWFENSGWDKNLDIMPDASLNVAEFHRQYHLNMKLWTEAFKFIRTQDLAQIEVGRYDLVPDSLFVIIDEYQTKDEENTRYESHRKFADIQYLISGQERIGVNKLDVSTVVQPYDSQKDIAFYEMSGDNYRMANQERFFIFFPTDAHRPCVVVDENKPVRKIVIKVRVTDPAVD